MKMRNLVKEKLEKNGYVLGAFVASGSPTNAEILGINNLDFILIDMEHAQTIWRQSLTWSEPLSYMEWHHLFVFTILLTVQ